MLIVPRGLRNSFDLRRLPCPKCGARGKFRKHGSYLRWNVTARKARRLPEERVEINRVLCRSCRSTHAVLPADLAPRSPYSRSFRREVAAARARPRAPTVLETCADLGISVRTFYRLRSPRDGPGGAKQGSDLRTRNANSNLPNS